MSCTKCKGKGHIKKDIPITLNWITSIIGFIVGPFYMEHRTYEKKPGKVAEIITCPKCKGTGKQSQQIPQLSRYSTSLIRKNAQVRFLQGSRFCLNYLVEEGRFLSSSFLLTIGCHRNYSMWFQRIFYNLLNRHIMPCLCFSKCTCKTHSEKLTCVFYQEQVVTPPPPVQICDCNCTVAEAAKCPKLRTPKKK